MENFPDLQYANVARPAIATFAMVANSAIAIIICLVCKPISKLEFSPNN